MRNSSLGYTRWTRSSLILVGQLFHCRNSRGSPGGVDLFLHAALAEDIDFDVSIFAQTKHMRHWRQSKIVTLKQGDYLGKYAARDNVPLVTPVSASAPVVVIRFVAVSQGNLAFWIGMVASL
jgi:hypothetical protein